MPYDMVTDDDGYIYVTGRTSSNGVDYDIRTVKMDSALNIIWTENYDFQGLYDVGQTIELDDFGNLYVGGYVTRANNVEEMVLIKYDASNGNELWDYQRASEDFTEPAQIVDLSASTNGDVFFLGQEMAKNGYNRLVVGKMTESGMTKWQRYTHQTNHETPLSIKWYDDTLIYVNSAIETGQGYEYLTRRYTEFTQDTSLVYVDDTIPAYRSNELIVRFKHDAVNKDAVDNLLEKRAEFEQLDYFLTPVAMETIDEMMLAERLCEPNGSDQNICELTAVKLFKNLTTDVDSTITRGGDTIRVPDFWTAFVVSFPFEIDIDQAKSIFSNLNDIIAYSEKNVIIELHNNYLGVNDEYWNDLEQLSLHDEYNFYGVYNPDDPSDTTRNASIKIKDAWGVYPEAGKPDIKCGVVDILIDFRHPDFGFKSNSPTNSSKVRGGHDFVTETDLYDFNLNDHNTAHGTEVSGIIGAIRNNDEGVAGIAGGDYQGNTDPNLPDYFDDKGISLYSLGIWNYTQTGYNMPQTIQPVYDAIVTASLHQGHGGMGLDILNNSWGYSETGLSGVTDTNYILLKESLMFANRNEVSVVASRGNIGSQSPNRVSYPACMDDDWIMNVGGTGVYGVYPKSSEFSHQTYYHPRIGNEVDFAAPVNPDLIYTTLSTHAPPNSNGDPYTSFSQTSAAAPHVSGAVGLLMSYLNGNIQPNSTLAPEDAERILELTADNYDNMGQYSDSIGWGKINLGAAFRLVEQPYNTLRHFNAISKELHFVSNSNIYIREPVQNDNNTWFTNGTYNANVYRLDGWRNHGHFLNDEDTVVEYWARPSGSDVFEELDSDTLLPRHRVTIDYLDKDSCHLHGYIYEILDGGGNTIGWLPTDTNLTKWNRLDLSYTILMRDSTAPTLNLEELGKDQHVLLYPNPSSNIQTVKLTGFANQDAKITLYDIQGRSLGVVHEGKLEDETILEFNVSGLSNGFYLYDVRMETERRTLRFIKQ